jgi:hypothetical protein
MTTKEDLHTIDADIKHSFAVSIRKKCGEAILRNPHLTDKMKEDLIKELCTFKDWNKT